MTSDRLTAQPLVESEFTSDTDDQDVKTFPNPSPDISKLSCRIGFFSESITSETQSESF
jgi:hypothetical protein